MRPPPERSSSPSTPARHSAPGRTRRRGCASSFWKRPPTPLACMEGRYDLVLANVLAEILIDLKQEITARMERGGWLVLSGILAEKRDWVEKEYETAGCRLAGEKG